MKRTDITALFPDATDEQINSLMAIHGNDINTMKQTLATTQASLAEAQAELQKNGTAAEDLQKALDNASALQKELDDMKAVDALRVMREKVATEMKIPARMLTMETEEDCRAQAQSILDFAKYPSVRDGGEPGAAPPKPSTREQFAEWLNNQS